jgi:short-subunit dehydrogenase involved in D-alanine esterification of teichoic acids
VNGIGFETARVLAKHANLIIITGHNSERLKLFLLPGYLLNADECTD